MNRFWRDRVGWDRNSQFYSEWLVKLNLFSIKLRTGFIARMSSTSLNFQYRHHVHRVEIAFECRRSLTLRADGVEIQHVRGARFRRKADIIEKLTSEMCQKPGDHRSSPENACRSADSRSKAARGSGPFWTAASASSDCCGAAMPTKIVPIAG